MKSELSALARNFLSDRGASSSPRIAERAAEACERLSRSLANIVGEQGVNTLFKRGAALVGRQGPWTVGTNPWQGDSRSDGPWLWLRTSMEVQDAEAATEAFVMVLSAVMDLLGRLVGEDVMACLLRDAWPSVFPSDDKGHT
jgi:predicted ArsR family transcriptional regulator